MTKNWAFLELQDTKKDYVVVKVKVNFKGSPNMHCKRCFTLSAGSRLVSILGYYRIHYVASVMMFLMNCGLSEIGYL